MTTELNGAVEEAVAVVEKHWFAIVRINGGKWKPVSFTDLDHRDRETVIRNAKRYWDGLSSEIKLICVEL